MKVYRATYLVIWKKESLPTPRTNGGDIRLWDIIMNGIQEFGKGFNCCSLLWALLGAIPWHTWQERNRGWSAGELRPHVKICREIIRDIRLSFELETMITWRSRFCYIWKSLLQVLAVTMVTTHC